MNQFASAVTCCRAEIRHAADQMLLCSPLCSDALAGCSDVVCSSVFKALNIFKRNLAAESTWSLRDLEAFHLPSRCQGLAAR